MVCRYEAGDYIVRQGEHENEHPCSGLCSRAGVLLLTRAGERDSVMHLLVDGLVVHHKAQEMAKRSSRSSRAIKFMTRWVEVVEARAARHMDMSVGVLVRAHRDYRGSSGRCLGRGLAVTNECNLLQVGEWHRTAFEDSTIEVSSKCLSGEQCGRQFGDVHSYW